MQTPISPVIPLLCLLALGCVDRPPTSGEGEAAGRPDLEALTPPERMERLVTVLAADSMEGRATGSDGARRAARFIAREAPHDVHVRTRALLHGALVEVGVGRHRNAALITATWTLAESQAILHAYIL